MAKRPVGNVAQRQSVNQASGAAMLFSGFGLRDFGCLLGLLDEQGFSEESRQFEADVARRSA
jgi:hypothetical protein